MTHQVHGDQPDMVERSLAVPHLPWYCVGMEPIRFELTPEQKSMLASLVRETGEPTSALLAAIAAALEELQEHEHLAVHDDTNSQEIASPDVMPSIEARKPIWEALIEAGLEIPDEELDLLPIDGATQHDHYIYSTPKRPA